MAPTCLLHSSTFEALRKSCNEEETNSLQWFLNNFDHRIFFFLAAAGGPLNIPVKCLRHAPREILEHVLWSQSGLDLNP